MSHDDVIGELYQTVKDLSEKNRTLTLKVNELEAKIEQVERNKSDISSLKTNIDAANTDRTAIKDLLNLKVTETKNNLDEKVNSFKNDFAFLKEDLNTLDSSMGSIKEKISKISTELQNSIKNITEGNLQNLTSTKDELNSKILKNVEDLSSFKTQLQSSIETITQNIDSVSNLFTESIDSVKQQVSGISNDLMEKLQASEGTLHEKIDHSVTGLSADLNIHKENTSNQFEKNASELASELQTISDGITGKFQEFNADLSQKLENQQSLITNLSSQTDLKVNTLNKQIEKFFDISDNHSEVLKIFEEVIGQIRANIQETSNEIKKDQELMLESFQKIISGQAENLRNELLTFSKEIRTNISKFNDDISSKFTSIDETTKINEKIKALDEDLHTRSENIRKMLVDTLDENVQKFNSAIKESISSVDEYRVDLERFKDDIESLVERKVNEKTEFSMELFNNLLTKAEQMRQLIQDSKITKIPQIAVPIPDIKSSERTDQE